MFLVLFCSRLAYNVTDNVKEKIHISRFILHSYNYIILFSKIIYVFDIVYVKSNSISWWIFWSELRGNAVTKAKGSSWLHKLKVVALTVRRRELAVFQCCRSPEDLNLNKSLNIKLRKKDIWTFWFLITSTFFFLEKF